MSKIQFWKQITTILALLWFLKSCMKYVKDTILKANHNVVILWWRYFQAVWSMSKIQFWKQITTAITVLNQFLGLYEVCQRYNFESKSQLDSRITHGILAVWSMSKIQFWKQITTTSIYLTPSLLLYEVCQRYNFESKSQLFFNASIIGFCCMKYVKDTILKANHNHARTYFSRIKAVWSMSKIQFWKQITTAMAWY